MSTNAIKHCSSIHYNDLKTILLTYGLVSMAIWIFLGGVPEGSPTSTVDFVFRPSVFHPSAGFNRNAAGQYERRHCANYTFLLASLRIGQVQITVNISCLVSLERS